MHLRCKSRVAKSISNPFGVIFHPLPLLRNLQLIAAAKNMESMLTELGSKDIFETAGIFHSLQHAHRFHNEENTVLQNQIFEVAATALKALEQSDAIFITLGTAWIYRHLPTQTFVGNCHKLPQQDFTKSLSSQSNTKSYIQEIIQVIRSINPLIQIVFTVSPVKHLRDGIQQNLQSKSTLISALVECIEEQTSSPEFKRAIYFPSYEIVHEELNDWRYFKDDKMHPTDEAINIVFERFYGTFFSIKDSTLGTTA